MRAIIIINCQDDSAASFYLLAPAGMSADMAAWKADVIMEKVIQADPNWKFSDVVEKLKEDGFDLPEVATCESTY